MSIVIGWYLFIAFLFSFYAWARMTLPENAPIERRFMAAGLSLIWPYFLVVKVRDVLESRAAKPAAMSSTNDAGPSPHDLEMFGRHQWEPASFEAAGDLEHRCYQQAQADQSGFLESVANSAESHGGWVAYGAERLAVSVVGGNLTHPAYDRLMHASTSFLRSCGVPQSRVTGYEWSWWLDHTPQGEPWLTGRPHPTEESSPVTRLVPGEVRRVAVMTAEPGSNVLYIAASTGGSGFEVLIDAAFSSEDPTRSRNVWHRASTLHELYSLTGNSLIVPPFWADPELAAYIPLDLPRLPR